MKKKTGATILKTTKLNTFYLDFRVGFEHVTTGGVSLKGKADVTMDVDLKGKTHNVSVDYLEWDSASWKKIDKLDLDSWKMEDGIEKELKKTYKGLNMSLGKRKI
jgi:hypothetical protein